MDRLGIEFISMLGLNPVDAIRLTAELGVRGTGIAPAPLNANPHGFAPWDLRGDPALVRAMKAASREYGVAITIGEGFLIMPGLAMTDMAATLDIMAELGAPVVNAVAVEPDRTRAIDEFGRFAEMAAARGLTAVLEFVPMIWPATIADALSFLAEVGAPNGKLLVDAMHVYRSGGTTAEVAALDPAMVGYVQLCDVPMVAQGDDYGAEASNNRLCPGEGELPLAALLRALPKTVPIGLEAPMAAKALAGLSLHDALEPCVTAARSLLAE